MVPTEIEQDRTVTTADRRRVLALPGSLRQRSFNRLLLGAAKQYAPPSMIVEVYDALPTIPLFNEDLEEAMQFGPEAAHQLRARVDAADGLLIATPEYNQSIPGVLKNVIDWLSRPTPKEVLVGKPIAIMGVTRGQWGTRLAQSALRHTLYATESRVMPTPSVFLREADKLFNETGQLINESTIDLLAAFMTSFDTWITDMRSK